MDPMRQLLEIMTRLRDPKSGCPWDRQQTFATIVPHTLEEAYEVVETIEHERYGDLRDELGDLLFQVVFYAQMAREAGLFDFQAVAESICDKLIRRHPHVFGEARIEDAAAQSAAWEQHKEAERRGKDDNAGVLDGVSRALPALTRAAKLQRRAARVGFDWPSLEPVWDKLREEIRELREALADKDDPSMARRELGDLLFTCVNLARHAGLDPEQALRETNTRFEGRFRYIESRLRQSGREPATATLEEMDRLWEEAKRMEKEHPGVTGGSDPASGPSRESQT